MTRLPVLEPSEVVPVLASLGFDEIRQRGSYRQFRHPDHGGAQRTGGGLFPRGSCCPHCQEPLRYGLRSWRNVLDLPGLGSPEEGVGRAPSAAMCSGRRVFLGPSRTDLHGPSRFGMFLGGSFNNAMAGGVALAAASGGVTAFDPVKLAQNAALTSGAQSEEGRRGGSQKLLTDEMSVGQGERTQPGKHRPGQRYVSLQRSRRSTALPHGPRAIQLRSRGLRGQASRPPRMPAARDASSGSPLGTMLLDLQEDGSSPQEAES
jgi:hypothetical protein